MQPILLQGKPIAASGLPVVCAPLVARDRAALVSEAKAVAAKGPDLLEWRVDFFEGIGRTAEVVALTRELHELTGLPLLFTRRSTREGGQTIALHEPQVIDLYRAVCADGIVHLLDHEMESDPTDVAAVRAAAHGNGIALVLSFHDFNGTPSQAQLQERFAHAHRLGADVAKVAVMPQGMDDVLALLAATWQASRTLPIPVVSMAMGALGAVTRIAGAAFGSALTFGMGQGASAPGQLPIEDLRAGLEIVQRAGAPR